MQMDDDHSQKNVKKIHVCQSFWQFWNGRPLPCTSSGPWMLHKSLQSPNGEERESYPVNLFKPPSRPGTNSHSFRPCSWASHAALCRWNPTPVSLRPTLKMGAPWIPARSSGTAKPSSISSRSASKSFSNNTNFLLKVSEVRYSSNETNRSAGPA